MSMKVQSASLDVPGGCPNHCKFCVTELWKKGDLPMLKNAFDFKSDDFEWIKKAFRERLIYLRQHDVDTIVLTGSASEAIFNKKYLELFQEVNESIGNDKFINIELQTSGVGLMENFLFLEDVGVKTISLSMASLDTDTNFEIMQTPEKFRTWDIVEICKAVKEAGFNLRLSLNMNLEGFKEYEKSKSEDFWHGKYSDLIEICQRLGADQVTFRKLYSTGEDGDVTSWIKRNQMDHFEPDWWEQLSQYIKKFGRPLNRLPFGAMKYSISNMSTVVDEDCMAKEGAKEDLKYMILRRNCRLYSEWDDPASLIF